MISDNLDQIYSDAVASGLLPGVSLWAGDKNGRILCSKSQGVASLKASKQQQPFTDSTICAVASLSKLMTSVAVLKAVELGKLDLDADVRPTFSSMGQYGVITDFDDEKNVAAFGPDSTPISLRMLLCHTSGHEYDWLNPLLGKWRASRNEIPWSGPTVEDKSAIPLVFAPGTNFAYGGGHDWAGKAVSVATNVTLEEFMREHIWKPLGLEGDVSFFPKKNPDMRRRIADLSTLDEKGEGPAIDAADFDILFGGTDCLGGGGIFSTPKAYYTFLSAVFRRDERLLTSESYDELFRPQLDEKAEQAFNDYLASSPVHTRFFTLGIPHSVRKTWTFAGMLCLDKLEGRFEEGTVFWAGVPNCVWFMDRKAGVCGTTVCQLIPPLHPPIVALHDQFQRRVLEMAKGTD
ncbi:beta-lactamase/transpeptidase-like protein [Podospora aff. communis PSN243]|uniref:Beta-lactamase/transpeptidase-like protein n=1 Tax=Podospora aff. communis PSN243 TaxID=3040156 RepID=A0AAV9GV76_9PEZI|nr:beta-lactamase/transpeptidase-like protein [Podospora aff. communis PSN243]